MVGIYAINGAKRSLIVDKIDDDFRHSVEFIMQMTKYTETELLKKDFVTFNKILIECEKRALKEIEKQKQDG